MVIRDRKHGRDAGLRKTATALDGEESHSQGSFLSVSGSFLLPQYVLIVCITGVPSVGTLLFLPDTQRLSGNHGGVISGYFISESENYKCEPRFLWIGRAVTS